MAAAATGARMARPKGQARGVGDKRMKAIKHELHEEKQIKELFDKYDTNKSGKLEEDQVKRLLTDMDSSTPPDTPPSEEELKFVIRLVDKEKDGCVAKDEVLYALRSWAVVTKHRVDIEKALDEFDKSKTGKLEPPELKAYLISLNSGIPVTDDEVKWVLSQADIFGDNACNRPELIMATCAWYAHINEKAEEKKGCCSVQ